MSRLSKAQQLLKEKDLDAVFLTDMSNVKYVSKFVGSIAYCLIKRDKGYLLADKRYFEQAKTQCRGFEVVEWNSVSKPYHVVLKQLCHNDRIKNVGFEKNKICYADYVKLCENQDVSITAIDSFIEELRYVKDENEIEVLKSAAAIADKAFADILNYIKPGVTEKDIQRELQISLLRYGAEGPSFDTIIAVGEHSAVEHAVPGDRAVKSGDFVLMDFGALYEGYHSDITRTVVVGHADDRQKEIYQRVYESNICAESRMKDGLPGIEAQKYSEEPVKDSKYFEFFSKGLGHGVGLDIHENPFMNYKCCQTLKSGCVVTVEPRIHINGFGGVRIEDMVIIREEKCEVITKSPKELLVL